MSNLINATGIIWHEELKIPPLPAEAVEAIKQETHALKDFEFFSGRKLQASRAEELSAFLAEAEDALVVNNLCAAAFLLLFAFAKGEEIFVSGKDISLAKAFPSLFTLLYSSSTTITYGSPEQLVGEKARKNLENYSLIFYRCDTSDRNDEKNLELLGSIAAECGIPLAVFCECASLLDITPYGLNAELMVQEKIRRGVDIIIFSADRFLGGPSAAIIAGKKSYCSLLKNEPLCSAFSPERRTLKALESTLELYLNEGEVFSRIPFLQMLSSSSEKLRERADYMAGELQKALDESYTIDISRGDALVSFNEQYLGSVPSFQLSLKSSRYTPRQLGELIYWKGDPPVIPHLKEETLLLDLRSVMEEEDPLLLNSLVSSLRENRRGRCFLNNVPAMFWVLDGENKIVYANKACQQFWDNAEPAGCGIDDVFSIENAAELTKGKERVVETEAAEQMEITVKDAAGQERYFDIIVSPGEEGSGEITFTGIDITRHKNQEAELIHLSMHDSLTGIYNRAYFEEEMRRLNNKRHYPISFVVCDVDGLKLINDILGHEKGDEMLKTAVEIIKRPFRESDVVARVGGDEFAIILPSTDYPTVENIAKRVKDAVDNYNRTNKGLPLSLSIGYATGETHEAKLEDIFRNADSEMYNDKFKRTEIVKKEIFDSLLRLFTEKDFIDKNQTEKLQRMVLFLGQAVGIPREELKNIMLLARVYDIGKINVGDEIIFKNGALSPLEWEKMKKHPEIGYRIAKNLPQTAGIANYILQHHEWWDGRGYPHGLKGKDIHLYSRILAVVDAYESMRSSRPYRSSFSHEKAVAELKKRRGTQFDPRIVDIFVTLLEEMKGELNAM